MDQDIRAIETAVQSYLDGLYEGDTKKLGEAFHPAAHLYSAGGDGKAADWPRSDWFKMVDGRPSAKVKGSARADRIVSIDFSGPATAFAKVGLSGDYGGTYFLTHLLGSAKARELYLMSPVLTAQEAFALGIVTRVVPDAEVESAAHELAMSLAQGPSVTLGYIKRNINNAETMSLEECFDAEAIHHSRSGETADHKEAAKAFVEKRKPVFRNH